MPKARIGPGADQLVIFLDRDAGAPVLSQMPSRPQCQRNPCPDQRNAREGKRVRSRNNLLAENPDPWVVDEEQNEDGTFKKEDAVARSERFRPLRTERLERADVPIGDKDDPGPFDDVMPTHSLFRSQGLVARS